MHRSHAPRGLLNEKSCGVGAGRARAVVGALEALGEAKPRRRSWRRAATRPLGEQDDAVAVALAKRGADRVGETAARLVADDQAVDDDQQFLREVMSIASVSELVEMLDRAVDAHAHEALRAQILDHDLVRDLVDSTSGKAT